MKILTLTLITLILITISIVVIFLIKKKKRIIKEKEIGVIFNDVKNEIKRYKKQYEKKHKIRESKLHEHHDHLIEEKNELENKTNIDKT